MEKYNTNWVKELPETCENCRGTTTDNSFKSKKGEMWNSVKCDNCLMKWIQTKPKAQNTGNTIILEEIQTGFKELNQRLDNMGEYLGKTLNEILKKND